jgi:Ser/Thr protein kinase RdoA (MazF antagonist)
MTDDEMMDFEVSTDEDDFSQALTVQAYDIGEAVDEYEKLLEERRARGEQVPRPSPNGNLFVRLKGEEQVYEFAALSADEEDVDDFGSVSED